MGLTWCVCGSLCCLDSFFSHLLTGCRLACAPGTDGEGRYAWPLVANLAKGAGACFYTVSLQRRSRGGLEEVVKLVNKEVADALGGLPAQKLHCSKLAADAVGAAIEDCWNKQKGTKNDEQQSRD
jgi:hypothetical protein